MHLDFDLFYLAHPAAQDVADLVFLKPLGRLGADHAPVGGHAKFAHTKTLSHPLHHRQQRCGIGGVPRPHLAANGVAVAIEQGLADAITEIIDCQQIVL